jgi:tetratricopeptide (TPR) repeat protein
MLHELGRYSDAIGAFDTATQLARQAVSVDAEARALTNLAITLLQRGRSDEATRALETARSLPVTEARGVVAFLSGLFAQRLGRHEEALVLYQEALPLLEAEDDTPTVATVHLNCGVIHGYRNDVVSASDCYRRAEAGARQEGMTILEAMAAHNLGFTVGRAGALADGLRALDRAARIYGRLGYQPRQLPVLHTDHAEILLAAGLVTSARHEAETAVACLAEADNPVDLQEARLLLARTCLAGGDPAAAQREAAAAAGGFARLGRQPWTALAAYVGMLAEAEPAATGRRAPPAGTLDRCSQVAGDLADHGWSIEAMDARYWAARLAARGGDTERASAELAAARRLRGRLPLASRVNRWCAHAEVARAAGEAARARRAVAAGLRLVEQHRSSLGATEARVEVSRLARGLAAIGVGLALRQGQPAAVLRAAERTRAIVLQMPPVAPPAGSPLADALDRIRPRLADRIGSAASPTRDGDESGDESRIETRIRRLVLSTEGSPSRVAPVGLAALRARLGHRALLELVEHEDQLVAVVVSAGAARLAPIGSVELVARARSHLDASLHHLLRRGPDMAARAAAAVARAAAELDRLVLGPLGLDHHEDLVIVPTGCLHGLAWSALPTLQHRRYCIAPSASLFARRIVTAGRRAGRSGESQPAVGRPGADRVLLVAGPHLAAAERELAALDEVHPQATVLDAPQATCQRVLAELERSDMAHIAAHGVTRRGNPMLTSLMLADGPMTMYDLERLHMVPSVVVVPACNAGAALVTADEVLGTAFALLSIGVDSVLAPVAPVPDHGLRPYLVPVHRALAAGCSPRSAHHQARRSAAAGDDPAVAAAAACFVPIGII